MTHVPVVIWVGMFMLCRVLIQLLRVGRDETEMRACVYLPTYNERENLASMLEALGKVLGPDDRVLVVDDGSPDGTGELADQLASELGFVDVLHRRVKEGLGPAYVAGFPAGLARGAERVL